MPHARALTLGLTLAVALAAVTVGVTYAATSTTPAVVYACANKAGTLKLLSKGTCPTGYAKVAIDKQGPRGLRGPRGPQGLQGPRGLQGTPGPQGPGAATLVAASTTNGVSATRTLALGALSLDVGVYCKPGTNAQFSVGFDPGAAPTDWTISGLTFTNGPSFGLKVNGTSYVGQSDAWGFDKTVAGESGNTVLVSVGTGSRFQASLLLVRDGHSATVDLALDAYANDACTARAQVTPSS